MTICSICKVDTSDMSPSATICRPCRRERYRINRHCNVCNEEIIGSGQHYRCKDCQAESNKKAKVKYQKKYKEYITAIGCVACGENHPSTLEVHHLRKGVKIGSSRSQSQNKNDIEEGTATVLCANCHNIFHTHFGGKWAYFPNQTIESAVQIIQDSRRLDT